MSEKRNKGEMVTLKNGRLTDAPLLNALLEEADQRIVDELARQNMRDLGLSEEEIDLALDLPKKHKTLQERSAEEYTRSFDESGKLNVDEEPTRKKD